MIKKIPPSHLNLLSGAVFAILSVFFASNTLAQTTLYSEDFESATQGELSTTAFNGWKQYTITPTVGDWSITNTCVITGSYCLTLHAYGVYCEYAWDDAGEEVAYYGTLIDATNYTGVKLSFKWQSRGEVSWDYGKICYSTNGTTWTNFTNTGTYVNQATTQTVTNLDISEVDATQFYLGFRWKNDGSVGTDPGFKVDDISVTATANNASPAAPTFYEIGGASQLCFNNSHIFDDTPMFRASTTDADANPVDYRIEIDNNADFLSITWTRDFTNGGAHYASGSTFDLTCATLTGITNATTYYYRIKAIDPTGSNTYGSYNSGTYSFTYKSSGEISWLQTAEGQFDGITLANCNTPGDNIGGITPTAIAQEQIGAGNDDAFDYSDGSNFPTAINSRMGFRSGAGFLDCTTGLRFQTVPLPQGATITTATLSVRAFDATSPTINTKISADDVDNSADFSATKPSGRTKTTSQVDWDVSTAWSTGTYYNSPEIKTVLQEIVNRTSWASNNNLSIIVANDGGTDNRNISTYDENTGYGARLNASYVVQGTATSSIVDYASFDGATAWNQIVWNDGETGSDIKYKVFYGTTPTIVPDGALAGNSAGFDTSPIDISGLNTGTYAKLTIVAYLNYTTASPSLNDWEITVSLGDQDSDADAPTTQVVGGTIPSTATAAGSAVDVFKFKIKDLATADSKVTKVTNIRIQPGAGNTADWTDHIQGVTLDYNGVPVTIGAPTITDTYVDIPITSPNLDIANGEITKEATLAVYLNTSNIIDNLVFECKITAASHGWTNGSNSSAFASSFGTDITSNQFTITVAATKLVYATSKPPTLVPLNQTFAVTVNATDANGNADADEASSVTLVLNTGTGVLTSTSNLTQTMAGGTYAWTDVYYNTVEACFQIEAQSGTLTNVTSACIQCVDKPGAFSLSAPLLTASCPGNVAVTWGASSGSTSFDLYYCTGTNCDPTLSSTLFTGVTSSYTFNASTYNNDTLRFQVKAINSAGETWSTNVGEHYVWLSNGGWGGGTSTDWNNAANWCGGVPTCSDSVVIQSNAPNQPVLTATGNVGDITIAAGASLGLGTFTMNVYGDFTNAGTVNSGTGTVKFTSTGCGGGSSYNMSNTTQSVSTGDSYHDDNGSASNYSSADYTQTLTPATAGKKVSITFSSFDVEFHATCGYDYLKIYDGPNVSSPLLGTFCGTTNPGTFTSTDAGGALTFKFFADASTVRPGWVGAITLLPAAAQTIDLGTSSLNNFTVEAATVTVINNTLDVNGNLAITNGGTLNGGTQTIEVAGTWNNTGTFSAGTSTVIFDGTGTSTITRLSSAATTVLSEGFETGTSGWTLGTLTGSTDWRRQTGGNTGSYDCGTYDLVGATAHGYYKPGNTSKNGYIDMSRSIDLRDYSSATLDFYWKCSGSGAFGYSGMVKMNGVDIITSNADAQLFSQSTFTAEPQISLNSYAGAINTLSFRYNLVYQSSSGSNPGFTIDDILIKGVTDKETFYNVQFNKTGGGRVDLAAKIDATNDLTIATGSTFDTKGFRIRSKGNFTNNGTFTHGNGEVIFSGTTVQTINGSSNTTFYAFSKTTAADLIIGDATTATTIEVSNKFSWTDNDDKIIIGNGQSSTFKINTDIYIRGGCTLETKNNCTALISGNYTNFGTYVYNQGKIEFYGATPSNVLREPALSIFSEDFESGTTGWTLGSSAGESAWVRSEGLAHASQYDCAVKDINVVVPYDYYWVGAVDITLTSPPIDLTGYTSAELSFWWKCGGGDAGQDKGRFYINDGTDNLILDNMYGQPDYIESARYDISAYLGKTITLKYRFTDDGVSGNSNAPGLCVDDILITTNSVETETFYDLTTNKTTINDSVFLRCLIDVNNDMNITAGTFNTGGNNTIPVGGNWESNTASGFTHNNNTIKFDGNGTGKAQLVDIGNSAFYNVEVDNTGGTVTLGDNTLDVDNHLTLTSGTLDAGVATPQDIEIDGNWLNNGGTFTPRLMKVSFIGLADQQIKSNSNAFYNAVVNKGGVLTLTDSMILTNDLTLTAGNLDVTASNRSITLAGDWINNGGTFTFRTGIVRFNGTVAQAANKDAAGIVNLADFKFYDIVIDGNDVIFYYDSHTYKLITHDILIKAGKSLKADDE